MATNCAQECRLATISTIVFLFFHLNDESTHKCGVKYGVFITKIHLFRLWDANSLKITHEFVKKQQILTSCDVRGHCIATSSGGINGTGCEITVCIILFLKAYYRAVFHLSRWVVFS